DTYLQDVEALIGIAPANVFDADIRLEAFIREAGADRDVALLQLLYRSACSAFCWKRSHRSFDPTRRLYPCQPTVRRPFCGAPRIFAISAAMKLPTAE